MERFDGLLPIYKDSGPTSHDVIYRLRSILNRQKIGHTGTLDPLASGLLPITLGRATKLTQFFTDWDKSYQAEITLGARSDTFDSEGHISDNREIPELSKDDIKGYLSAFIGKIIQKVPSFSAVKVKGKELYKYARRGIKVETPNREIEIHSIDLLSYDRHKLTIRVDCGKGTYIRVLANDLGNNIGCGAYLSGLKRLRAGSLEIDSALTLESVSELYNNGKLAKHIIPMRDVIEFPILSVSLEAEKSIKHGGVPERKEILNWNREFLPGNLVAMASQNGNILAIGKSKCSAASLKSNLDNDYFSFVRVLI
ncbi:MAG: tRNA pseudouridine(55) synthase TruB [candidate division Zixibacteria bacterium]